MEERTSGIVLRVRPLTETSLIVHWLTERFGRIATVVKGARRPKSIFRGKLDLFYLDDISFSRSRRSELHTLREAVMREPHNALRQGLGRLQRAAYGAALIEQTTETETPLPGMFVLFKDYLGQLSEQPPGITVVAAFEMKLLSELGLAPDLGESTLSDGAVQILKRFTELDWPALLRVRPSAAQSREIQQFLHGFLIYHLGRIPEGRSAALRGEVE